MSVTDAAESPPEATVPAPRSSPARGIALGAGLSAPIWLGILYGLRVMLNI